MKRIILSFATLALTATMMAQAPAFPGAEGHGRYTKGGRGGKVIHVTNLKDDGSTGSLRWALKQSGTKYIVFDVSGYIDLKSQLNIPSNTTIAGQTAPGDGITLRYYTVYLNGDNIVMRFIRSRRSQVKDVNDGADATWGRHHKNVIFDHCSFSWSIDEVASFYDNRDFTMQWCNITEGLANPGHSKGEHSYGGIWGGKGASFHHNLIAHVQNRSPRFCGARYNWEGYDKTKYSSSIEAEIVDFRNCVIYNWGSGAGCYGGTGGGNINIVNNYYKAGPGTSNKKNVTTVSVATSGNASGSPFMGYACRYFINGNYVTAASPSANYDWSGVKYDNGLSTINGQYYIPDADHNYGSNVTYKKNSSNVDCVKLKLDEAVDAGEVTTHSAKNAFDKVIAYAGASLKRDEVDKRYYNEAKNGTTTYTGAKSGRKGILDVINDPNGTQNSATASYPPLVNETRPSSFDSDNDGMPDAWETANGLNPNDASDAMKYTLDPEGYYTNIEVYSNSLVQDIIIAQNQNADDAVNDYFPAYYKEDGTYVAAVNPLHSAINDASADMGNIVSTMYYNLQGQRIAQPSAAPCIKVDRFDNGRTKVTKIAVAK